ncbi:hypothetical protein UY3_06022 [Chelonia mydas]|uniref:Uncharacterized protein n=1 Tax=Chelonia mydas TaxID=8469 RepID=M7BM40_CHEMY|nr:hypothetical protein UY3_06022 [Chelonia mydas]
MPENDSSIGEAPGKGSASSPLLELFPTRGKDSGSSLLLEPFPPADRAGCPAEEPAQVQAVIWEGVNEGFHPIRLNLEDTAPHNHILVSGLFQNGGTCVMEPKLAMNIQL